MSNQKNKCEWCGNETDLPRTYQAMGPLSEKYELLLLEFEKKYGGKWFDSEEIEPKLLEEVAFYDQITNTVSKGVVCADCLDKDDKMYTKFRKK